MSNAYWQIRKQKEQYKSGQSVTQKVKDYTKIWEARCYPTGIPDEVPKKLMKSGRAPSYKAIAMAILSNDIYFYSIGFEQKQSSILMGIIEANKPKNETQIRLFA